MFAGLPYPPANYEICPCCGTEFGNDDAQFSHEQLRSAWLQRGAPWFFGNPPQGWNEEQQLYASGLGFSFINIERPIMRITPLSVGNIAITIGDFEDTEQFAGVGA